MPKSKHRRKPGGKAVHHPGRQRLDQMAEMISRQTRLYDRFSRNYLKPFTDRHGCEDQRSFMLETIAGEAFAPDCTLQPVSKAQILRIVTEPPDPSFLEPDESTQAPFDAESAESCL